MALAVEDARALFERRRAAWLAEDAVGYLALFADALVMQLPGRAEPIRGKAAYARLVAASFARLRPVSWEFHRLAVDADHVLSEWTIAGEERASGRAVRWRGMSICRVEAGVIHEWREYWDPAALGK
jgi:ketosteroid isomerase-like protein